MCELIDISVSQIHWKIFFEIIQFLSNVIESLIFQIRLVFSFKDKYCQIQRKLMNSIGSQIDSIKLSNV